MPFALIKGTFHAAHYQQDGDSIRFRADNAVQWEKLDEPNVKLKAQQHAHLRIQVIDTLETHYRGHHRPVHFARDATQFLLAGLGITSDKFGGSAATVSSTRDGTHGYILSRTTEEMRHLTSTATRCEQTSERASKEGTI